MSAPRNLVLWGGPPGHDFEAMAAEVGNALSRDGVVTDTTTEPADAADRLARPASRPDLLTVIALRWTMPQERYQQERAQWAYSPDPATRAAIAHHVAAGGGLLAVHTSCICFDDWPEWADLLGASWNWAHSSHGPRAPALVEPTDHDHPITDRIGSFTVTDEVYEGLAVGPGLRALLVARTSAGAQPVFWARTHGRGRVVVDTLGHDAASLRHPSHAALLRRGAQWAMGRPDHAVRAGARAHA